MLLFDGGAHNFSLAALPLGLNPFRIPPDEAMYAAKLTGRSGFRFYSSTPAKPPDPNTRQQGN